MLATLPTHLLRSNAANGSTDMISLATSTPTTAPAFMEPNIASSILDASKVWDNWDLWKRINDGEWRVLIEILDNMLNLTRTNTTNTMSILNVLQISSIYQMLSVQIVRDHRVLGCHDKHARCQAQTGLLWSCLRSRVLHKIDLAR